MRFLFIVTNLRTGGAEKAVLKIASGLSARGHESRLILLENVIEYPVPEAIHIHALTPKDVPLSSGWIGKRVVAARLARLYRNLAKQAPFELTVSTLPFADEVAQIARLPRVWYRIANTLSAEIEQLSVKNSRKARRRQSRYRRLYEGKNLIAVSKGVAADLRERLLLAKARIETIYNPFDFEEISNRAQAAEPDLPKRPYILHVGRFEPQKRHDLLLDAFQIARLPLDLVLLTRPSPGLIDLIASRGLESRVIVAGFRDNPYPWYSHASALVLSSDREGMPNVLIESLICGTPVVSTDCPSGPRELLSGPMSRWLVPCGDASALAARMREVVETRPSIDPRILEPFAHTSILQAYESLAGEIPD